MKTGDGCPLTFADIMEKLRVTDSDNSSCKTDNRKAGIATRVISETAAQDDRKTNYRTVVSRTCNDRSTFEFLFSTSTFSQGSGFSDPPSDFLEVIALDKAEGVFNYYEANGAAITFFGSSVDFVTRPVTQTGRCAGCHTGGGLVMKELPTPWMHWDSSHMALPGAKEMVAGIENFGNFASGAEMEGLTGSGNNTWNKARVELFKKKGDVKNLLRPLFCDTEINLNNAVGFPGNQVTQIPAKMLNDISRFGQTPAFTNDDYLAQLKLNGQRMEGLTKKQIDTNIPLVFLERAGSDRDYVSKLSQQGVVDAEFVSDVLLVDFTRPIFSDDRCNLLALAPNLAPEEINPENIRRASRPAWRAHRASPPRSCCAT